MLFILGEGVVLSVCFSKQNVCCLLLVDMAPMAFCFLKIDSFFDDVVEHAKSNWMVSAMLTCM